MTATGMRVAICISTFRRPELLRRLLASLDRLALPSEPAVDVRLVVVDNDAAGTAAEAIQTYQQHGRWPVTYESEPTQNIALARNRAVHAALRQRVAWVAFVDDDETVEPDWLHQLLRVQSLYGADVVTGPVKPEYDAEVPSWIVRGGFFEQPVLATGSPIADSGTGNVLVSADWLRRFAEPFDPAFGRSGGSDSHFFIRLHRAGARMVWAEEAVAREGVTAERANLRWILRRAYRVGNAGVRVERALSGGSPWAAQRTAKSLVRLGGAVALLPVGLLRPHAVPRALSRAAYSLGCLAAVGGAGFQEYPGDKGEKRKGK